MNNSLKQVKIIVFKILRNAVNFQTLKIARVEPHFGIEGQNTCLMQIGSALVDIQFFGHQC